MNLKYEQAKNTAAFIKNFFTHIPDTALVLGSGLGNLAEKISSKRVLNYSQIPNFPRSTAPGHSGNLILADLYGHKIFILQGRVHFYEYHSMDSVTFPVKVLSALGVKNYIATNASGAINTNFQPGDVIAVRDHLNLMGDNPLIGETFTTSASERFPDMSNAYDIDFLEILKKLGLKTGVYAAFSGPSFETPSEVRAAGILGADLVGMSTVPEVIVANALKMRVAVLSCVANMAAGVSKNKLSGQEVLDAMKNFSEKINDTIIKFLDILDTTPAT